MSIGFATCTGGDDPDPPIHDYPLLVWVGGEVRTEDGAASVDEIAVAGTSDIRALADRFGTTPEHVMQALDYARLTRDGG
jgi:hypothetical protein